MFYWLNNATASPRWPAFKRKTLSLTKISLRPHFEQPGKVTEQIPYQLNSAAMLTAMYWGMVGAEVWFNKCSNYCFLLKLWSNILHIHMLKSIKNRLGLRESQGSVPVNNARLMYLKYRRQQNCHPHWVIGSTLRTRWKFKLLES